MHEELTDRALKPWISLVVVFTTANEACLVRMLEHPHKTFTDGLSNNEVFVSFLSGPFVLISELFQFMGLYFAVSFIFQSDVV